MSGLVGYDSSEDEDNIQPEKSTKIAELEISKTATVTDSSQVKASRSQQDVPDRSIPQADAQVTRGNPEDFQSNKVSSQPPGQVPSESPPSGPAQGPSQIPTSAVDEDALTSPPSSPYTTERQRLRDLTMPTNPSFLIPDAPPPPASNSEEALTLSQTTKKFERFLTLKKQNIHFNERLAKHPALENPSFLTNLMNVAGITLEQSYASSLAPESAVRTNWPESCFVEKLVWQNERREKKRLGERGKVDFVPSSSREL